MIIKGLLLQNYRNYQEQEIEFCDKVNVVYGNNAQGKTNILEAIYMFSSAKSHRAAKDKELIKFSQDHAKMTIFFDAYGRDNRAEMELFSNKRKLIRLNGVSLNRVSRLIGFFNTVLFCPEDLYLIKGGPFERRRFLDAAISPLKPNYFTALVQYNKILEHKNKLLKELAQNPALSSTIDVWNQKLCETGARVMVYRNAFIRKLNELTRDIHLEITDQREELSLSYCPSILTDDYDNEVSIQNAFVRTIEKNFDREKAAQMSLYGPHRDDIDFFINGVSVKNFGSQGQQRTVVLSVKMAQIELVKQAVNEYPVLLLDDIMSELDKNRQAYLLEKIENHQVIITCTDAYAIKRGDNKSFYSVQNGIVKKDD